MSELRSRCECVDERKSEEGLIDVDRSWWSMKKKNKEKKTRKGGVKRQKGKTMKRKRKERKK